MRKEIAIRDPDGLVKMIVKHAATALDNSRLLRVYWYDGVSGKLSDEQLALSQLSDVQLRQGIISRSGVQKGVDSKIMADLIELSGNHAISDAMLVTGDGDLVIGIELAQKRGVRVAVLGIEDESVGVAHNQSFEVVGIADRVVRIHKSDIAPYLAYVQTAPASSAAKPVKTVTPKAAERVPEKKKQTPAKKAEKPSPPSALAGPPKVDLQAVVTQFIEASSPSLTAASVSPNGTIGQSVDGQLLQAATAPLGRTLTTAERAELRDHFRLQIARRSPSPTEAS